MNMQQKLHPVKLKSPFYQHESGAGLHRYLDADFINRFRQDVVSGHLDAAHGSGWQNEESHSQWDNLPVLRLPTHRTFHLVCCEAVCDQLGQPALDPQKITSAGFVIRRITPEGQQAWMLEGGDVIGWKPAPTHSGDPDLDRRLCASGVLGKRTGNPSYTGEQTHPLHTLGTRDPEGRSRTLLFGYLPLGGFRYHQDATSAVQPESLAEAREFDAQSLHWPFGFRNRAGGQWQDNDVLQVASGQPTLAFLDLVRLLAERYRLGASSTPENKNLEQLCSGIWFHSTPDHLAAHLMKPGLEEEGLLRQYREQTLLDYLRHCFQQAENPLVAWLDQQEERLESGAEPQRLPDSDGSGSLGWHLTLSEEQAYAFRHLLGQRYQQLVLDQAREIPVPKFGDGENDVFRVVPFLRVRNDQGREQIVWADESSQTLPFRVASPLDPDASRPSLIPVPGMRDLKRGMAKGASLLTPSDTFAMLKRLRPKKGIGKDLMGDEVPQSGMQWILIFSLPVITLVAMILLMVMVSLLNIIFFWLPWVKIYLPFPKINR
ncbi:hypothetical protein [Marinobacter orientalis]|uniref:Uncharacterized protein n=1 Tax=Marinobacter orientalis TaxID=1928859 RepID=A0A7Y0WTR1_9GAMM|nr:hypothetical protein [Marinobacter orientalis]NMT64990.1 hypothetical protein [Marinobacter orientalis]TGX48118.1 hypothetical protein DIT72_15980 [Marinobacter orientalis]